MKPTMAERMARFATSASWEELSRDARSAISRLLIDSIGCASGALGAAPMRSLRDHVIDFGGDPISSMIGGGKTAPDRAALVDGALIRYLDFNDSYLAPGETCHPSDCLGALLAAGDYANASGRDLAAAMAVSYQIQCRLSDLAPVRERGFDHTTHLAYSVAAAVSRLLGLSAAETANAIAIAGAAGVNLRVTRTGALSNWKGMAAPNASAAALHATFLAARGLTGPPEVFEGNKGFMHSASKRFEIDWESEPLDRVGSVALKRFNAEVHSQSALEAAIELRDEHMFAGDQVEKVEVEIFDVAHRIIGGGEEGDKTRVATKEEADHSLQYMVAVALIDGQVLPRQYEPSRIVSKDVQRLLRRVEVRPAVDLSARFPAEHPCRIAVTLADGRILRRSKTDYEGYPTRPMSEETLMSKFDSLTDDRLEDAMKDEILGAVASLEEIGVRDLTGLLERIPSERKEKVP